MAQAEKARVFMNGRSQAVCIPARLRFKTFEVYIRHNEATGEITLSEKPPRMSLDEIYAALDAAKAIKRLSWSATKALRRTVCSLSSRQVYMLDTNTATYIVKGQSKRAQIGVS